MKLCKIAAFVCLALGLGAEPVRADDRPCGLALVLSVDVSSSIDAGEYYLQMKGMARAFRNPQLRDALLGQSNDPVIATVVNGAHSTRRAQSADSVSQRSRIFGEAVAQDAVREAGH